MPHAAELPTRLDPSDEGAASPVRCREAIVCAGLLLLAMPAGAGPAQAGTAKKTQFHGAIAYHPGSGGVGWATDRRSSREARVEALRQCGHPECEIVGTVRAGCSALARSLGRFKVQSGATRQEAEAKALRRCGEGCEIAAWTCTR